MLPQQNVRRNPVSQPGNPQHYADARMHSNPQPIPQSSSLNPLHRGGTPTARNFPGGFSPAQSPQTGQYAPSPSMYPPGNMGHGEINQSSYPSVVSQSPSTKSHANGQYSSGMWQQGHPASVQYAPHSVQTQVRPQHHYGGGNPMTFAKYQQRPPMQSQGPTFPGYNPTQTVMQASVAGSMNYHVRPRFSQGGTHPIPTGSAHSQMPVSSGTYYPQTQQPYYSTQVQIPPATQYAGGHYEPSVYQGNQQSMHNPSSMMQQPPAISMPMQQQLQQQQQQQQQTQRKKVIIKDPKTLRDVTNDILQTGNQSDTGSAPSPSPSTSSIGFQPREQIQAQFAAQVAAAAGHQASPSNVPQAQLPSAPAEMAHSPMRHYMPQQPMKSASPGPGSLLPSGIDTSVPPPSLPNMAAMIPPGTSPRHSNPINLPPPSMQGLPHHFAPSPNIMGTSPKTVPIANTPPRLLSHLHSDTPPIAVVIPTPILPHSKPPEVVAKTPPRVSVLPMKTDEALDRKIQAVLLAAEASQEEKLLQDMVSNQPLKKTDRPHIVPEVPFPAAMPESALDDPEPDSKDDDSSAHLVDSSPIPEDASASLSQDVDTDVAISETSEATDKNISDLACETPKQNDSDANPQEVLSETDMMPEAIAESLVAEDKGDVSLPESPKADMESAEKSTTPLSSGDSAVNEPVDKVVPKPAEEVEITSASQQGTDVMKTDAQLESQSSPIVESDTNEGEVSTTADAPESAPIETPGAVPTAAPGKKVYDREFLLTFRFHSSSMEKPIDLPPIDEIIMDKPPSKSSISTAPPFYRDGPDFAPSWMRGPSQRGGGRQSSRGSRPGPPRQGFGGGYPGQMGPPKVITKSIQKEPELNKAENAWKPSKLEAKSSAPITSEEEQTEEVLKNVRSILNKLTPSKFGALMVKFKQLPINSETRLREVINLIFEKAIDEPNFCEAYANMCRTMSQFKVSTPAPGQGGAPQTSTVEFRKVLLTRCQREFEKDRTNEDKLSDLRKKVEEAKTPEEKQLLKEELTSQESKERRRMLGNIRFIGELFKLQMLTETIMHNCIMSLFRGRDDESLESLCRLLTTIGSQLDHPKGKARMGQYFQQIEKIIKEKKTSSRVRFMLRDVVDLRLNNWVPRATQSQGPKTIDQIHQDAKDEKEQKAALHQAAAAAAASAPKNQSRGGRMGSRGNNPHNNQDDGWTKVQKPMRIDPMKMKLSKFDESNVTLGPPRGKLGWKSGSGSSTTRTGSGGYSGRDTLEGITPRSSTPTTMNRFSALGGPGNQDHGQRGFGK